MNYRIVLITLFLSLPIILFGQQISTKKCKDCGKPLSQCQYKGNHPNPNTMSATGLFQEGKKLYDKGIPQYRTKAKGYFEKAVQKGHVKSLYYLGELCLNEKEQQIAYWEKGVSLGDTDCMRALGYLLLGNGYLAQVGDSDKRRGYKLLEQASSQGDYQAKLYLGHCYFMDHQDEKALKNWLDAVNNGDTETIRSSACCELGDYYIGSVRGFAVNEKTAIKWYERAASYSVAEARSAINILINIYSAGEYKDLPRCRYWCQKLIDEGLEFQINEKILIAVGLKKDSNAVVFSDAKRKEIIQRLIGNMITIAGGTYTMGEGPAKNGNLYNTKGPEHKVTLGNFAIGKYEVTQAEWIAVMETNPSKFRGENLPVENVSWYDCKNFIQKLNVLTGLSFRLPTEAEWEFAAMGGIISYNYKYSGSNYINEVGWYEGNSNGSTHEVGMKKPNELDLYDMTGNVYEWCEDDHFFYSTAPQKDPLPKGDGRVRVYRGGNFCMKEEYETVKDRSSNGPSYTWAGGLGLRLALSISK